MNERVANLLHFGNHGVPGIFAGGLEFVELGEGKLGLLTEQGDFVLAANT
jgi:hypothetical protein